MSPQELHGTWFPLVSGRIEHIQLSAQMEALKTIPNSGIVPTTDIGDEFCIHPSQKDAAGLRLATLALTKTYGIHRLPSNGPMMTKVDYADKKL